MSDKIIRWVDGRREPQNPPHPDYPNGKDLDTSGGSDKTCTMSLPYPAKRCGHFEIRCLTCGLTAIVTTAGRPDDPRSIKVACKDGAGPNYRPILSPLHPNYQASPAGSPKPRLN